MPRYGQKDTCWCGRPIKWTGKCWEHPDGTYRHVAHPVQEPEEDAPKDVKGK